MLIDLFKQVSRETSPADAGRKEQFTYQHTQLEPSSHPQLNSAAIEREVPMGVSFFSE